MSPETAALPTIVLVHGAWHGSWAWDQVVPLLTERGFRVRTVDLPSTGPDVDALGGLADDVATVRAVLDDVAGPTVLVGHSYGGLPVTEASAGRDDVVRLVYVCAFLLDAGVSLLDAAGGEPPAFWQVSEDGRWMTPAQPEQVFYADCPPDVTAAAVARLTPQSLSSCTTPLQATGWSTIPATYVVADADAGLPAAVQELMAGGRAEDIRHIDTAHSPFFARPRELAGILLEVSSAAR
ncbi:alpha/beta hydrolase [Blastococcus saxobsidens]|uniref:Pimeloyl-ACP methyl ester carboxylesterase n=1 Tax=Blastococcus saxobsidens TaxID=138336 RepID=A0A4V6MFL3_9ACTN|nr:alpha/beta hydrolase [Blastococcus saxobsidens]RZU32746.1 pimeloyl-ACP methyl ester carboxylesterase [Blastococcus saxobsidens]